LDIFSLEGFNSTLAFQALPTVRRLQIFDVGQLQPPSTESQVVNALLIAAASSSTSLHSLSLRPPFESFSVPWGQFSLTQLDLTIAVITSLEDLTPLSLLPNVPDLILTNRMNCLPDYPFPGGRQQHGSHKSREIAFLVIGGDMQFAYWATRQLSLKPVLENLMVHLTHHDLERNSILPQFLHFIFHHQPNLQSIVIIHILSDRHEPNEDHNILDQSELARIPQGLFSSLANLRSINKIVLENVFFADPTFVLQFVNHLPFLPTLKKLRLLPVPASRLPRHAITFPTLGHLQLISSQLPNLEQLDIKLDCSSFPLFLGPNTQLTPASHPLTQLFIVPSSPLLETCTHAQFVSLSFYLDNLFPFVDDMVSRFDQDAGDHYMDEQTRSMHSFWSAMGGLLKGYQGLRQVAASSNS